MPPLLAGCRATDRGRGARDHFNHLVSALLIKVSSKFCGNNWKRRISLLKTPRYLSGIFPTKSRLSSTNRRLLQTLRKLPRNFLDTFDCCWEQVPRCFRRSVVLLLAHHRVTISTYQVFKISGSFLRNCVGTVDLLTGGAAPLLQEILFHLQAAVWAPLLQLTVGAHRGRSRHRLGTFSGHADM